MGLDLKTINQYLGVTTTSTNIFPLTYANPKTTTAEVKSTYVEPKSTYVEPKASYSEPAALAESRANLTKDLSGIQTAQYSWSNLLNSITNKASSETTMLTA